MQLSLEQVVEALLEYELRQHRFASSSPVMMNMVHCLPPTPLEEQRVVSSTGGKFATCGRDGWSSRGRLHCQICNRIGHSTQRCYYHYNRSAPIALPSPRLMVSSLPPAPLRLNAGQRAILSTNQVPCMSERDCSNPKWAPLVGPHPRQSRVDPCANNVEFQGVTIEWLDDDVGYECQ